MLIPTFFITYSNLKRSKPGQSQYEQLQFQRFLDLNGDTQSRKPTNFIFFILESSTENIRGQCVNNADPTSAAPYSYCKSDGKFSFLLYLITYYDRQLEERPMAID